MVSIFPISERILEELIPITSDFTAIWVDFFYENLKYLDAIKSLLDMKY